MTALRITLAALAVWRLTHLLHAEDGPLVWGDFATSTIRE